MPVKNLIKEKLSCQIIDKAKELGFYDCGISIAEKLSEDALHMENWLKNGHHGTMSYLERNKEKRYDPTLLVEDAKSVITVIYNYFPGLKLNKKDDDFKISKYAFGTDYHWVIKEKLKKLAGFMDETAGKVNSRVFVDSAPVLDRAWAKKSGLGFVGKNTMLINRKIGSYFFIGHIITALELKVTNEKTVRNFCGNCTKCIDACPTSAIKNGYIDARNCISYLTIEYRGELNDYSKNEFNNWIYGCDICQDVCPWNNFAQPHNEPLFNPNESLRNMKKKDWIELDKQKFNELFKGSAVNRTRFTGLRRNIDKLIE